MIVPGSTWAGGNTHEGYRNHDDPEYIDAKARNEAIAEAHRASRVTRVRGPGTCDRCGNTTLTPGATRHNWDCQRYLSGFARNR